jgi:hypothetical protein
MRVTLPQGHNITTARFQRVSKGVDYAYAAYRCPPARVRPFIAAALTFFVVMALFALAVRN